MPVQELVHSVVEANDGQDERTSGGCRHDVDC